MRLAVVGLLACLSCSGPPQQVVKPAPVTERKPAPFKPAPPPPDFRLPRVFVPISHELSLSIVDPELVGTKQIGSHLDGTIRITGDVVTATPVIYLHAIDIVVYRATATHAGTSIELAVSPQPASETIALVPDRPFATGRWVLAIEYRARIVDHGEVPIDKPSPSTPPSHGVFSQVVDKRRYTFTQFEPMSARRAFPCIDEPDRKIPWQLTIEVAADQLVASNTAIVRETPLAGRRKRVELARTQPLPSYLVAFAAGPFDVVDAGASKSGVPFRILTQHGRAADAAWATPWPAKIMDALEAWLDTPYAYGKVDFVAMPRAGPHWMAMENPGLVTFQTSLLGLPTTWVYVMEHELAHQWFGNLVTLAWWDDIWLNEGFAVWMSDKIALPRVPPDPPFDPATTHGSGDVRRPPRIRPRPADVASRSTIQPYFGGHFSVGLVEQLERYLGEDGWRRAIRAYVRTHAHKTATTADLAAALAEVAGHPVQDTLDRAVDGFRKADVTFDLLCAPRPHVRIATEATHVVPLCFAYDRDGQREDRCQAIDQPVKEIELPVKACPTWALPRGGLVDVKWSNQAVRAVIDRGWSKLTGPEQLALYHRSSIFLDDPTKLRVLAHLAERSDATGDAAGQLLARFVLDVPADLRPKLEAWIQKHFIERARAVGLDARSRKSLPPGSGPLILAALVHDPELVRQALALFAKHGELDPISIDITLTLAANADRAVAETLLADVLAAAGRDPRRSPRSPLKLAAVGASKFAVDLVRVNAPSLSSQMVVAVLTSRCDAARRAEVIAAKLDPEIVKTALVRLDRCVATSAKLDPAFRAWLAPKRP